MRYIDAKKKAFVKKETFPDMTPRINKKTSNYWKTLCNVTGMSIEDKTIRNHLYHIFNDYNFVGWLQCRWSRVGCIRWLLSIYVRHAHNRCRGCTDLKIVGQQRPAQIKSILRGSQSRCPCLFVCWKGIQIRKNHWYDRLKCQAEIKLVINNDSNNNN